MNEITEYHTTESLAEFLGLSGQCGRNRVSAGEWSASARTVTGKPLFSEDDVTAVVSYEMDSGERRGRPPRVANVRDYGAKGDGKTNDSIAIQRAINAVAKGKESR